MPGCNSCQSAIVWAVTEKGRRMPMDLEPSFRGTFRLEQRGTEGTVAVFVKKEDRKGPLYTSHYATCPQAAGWRKKK